MVLIVIINYNYVNFYYIIIIVTCARSYVRYVFY
jgi:hypothetical protein